jgi:FtsP/CotA-like multicopper oxidase with cupredoxin domain
MGNLLECQYFFQSPCSYNHLLRTLFYSGLQQFHQDFPPTPVFVYGTSAETATFPGPTIVARHGVPLYVKWENHLPDYHILPTDNTVSTPNLTSGGVPTVVHLHGSVHPPQSDGSAFSWFTRDYKEVGPKWTQTTYTYPNIQPPGNLWYDMKLLIIILVL